MKLTCDQATTICDKNQYKEASLIEKMKLILHLFLCKNCGRYSKQNNVMTKCYEFHKESENKKSNCLCEEEKKGMERELIKKYN